MRSFISRKFQTRKSVLAIALMTSAMSQLPLSAAVLLPQPVAPASMTASIASTPLMNGGQKELLERAIEAAETISDPADKAFTLVEIAVFYLIYEQFDLAANILAQASAIASTISDPKARVQRLINIASLESQLPQPLNPTARIEELQALINQVPATVNRDSLFLGLAQLQASQGQFDRLSQTLAQIQDFDGIEYAEYGALFNSEFWAFQPEPYDRATAEIEPAEPSPPLVQPPVHLSAADLLIVNRIKILTHLFERAGSFQQDSTAMEQIAAQQQVLLAQIQQQIAHLQDPDLQLQHQARLVISLASLNKFRTEAVAQYKQLLASIVTSRSPALHQAELLSDITSVLADPALAAAQSGVQFVETLLAQVDDSQLPRKVAVLHRLAGILFEVQPERAIAFTQQAGQLIARIPQASDRATAWIESAQLYQQLGQPAAAIAALEQVMPLLAEVEQPIDLALRWSALGRIDQVEQIVEQINDPATLSTLAALYVEQGELEQALTLKDRATQRLTQIGILQQVSQAYVAANQPDRAAALAQETIALLQNAPPNDDLSQANLSLALLSVIQTYLRTGVPLDSVFQVVDSIDRAEVQAAFYGQWLMQGELPTAQAGIWQRFERAIAATQDPKLRDRGWSYFAVSARRLQQPDRFEQAIAAIQDPQVKADTLLASVVASQNSPAQATP